MNNHLHRRLTLPKFLFRQAQRVIEQPQPPHSWGLATSLLQDAVEVFLRVLAEHCRIRVTASADFPTLFDRVGHDIDSVADYRAALSSLNNARVAFKHRGEEVSATRAQVFYANVEQFLSEVCNTAFDIDFTSLSLADAIAHQRTQNWLKRAERALTEERYPVAVARAAGAMAIYQAHVNAHDPPQPRWRLGARHISTESVELQLLNQEITEDIAWLVHRLDLVTRGIDVRAHDRFMVHAPSTSVMGDGSIQQTWFANTTELTREDARFCINFVIDAALALGESKLTNPDAQAEKRVAAKTRCKVVIYPAGDAETIRQAEPGEELDLAPASHLHAINSEFLPVMQDGDIAYVRRDCVEENRSAADVHGEG